MKHFTFFSLLLLIFALDLSAQVPQYDESCSTPNLDSTNAVNLPYYGNNQVLENYLVQNGYNNLPYISFPTNPVARGNSTFLAPAHFIPLNIYIYRDGAGTPTSAITESEARELVCRVNTIYRDAGTAIQFYTNRVEFESNDFFNNQVSTNLHVYDLWSRKRYIADNSKGINVHFLRYNNAPENNFGKASLPHYPVAPYAEYSLYVRTHEVYENGAYGGPRSDEERAATFAHEIGHTLGLLHTHHPGRLQSLAFNQENATIVNGCLQESVSRTRKNDTFNGCLGTDNKLKCEINGDFLCDTAADPNQKNRTTGAAPNCTYNLAASGDYREDNWGELWTPPTQNVMAYTTPACRKEFSRSQVGIMWMQMPHFKNYVNYQAPQIASSSSYVCSGSSTSFSLSGSLPNDAVITWEVQPSSLVSVSSGSGSTASLSAASSSTNGSANIIFTVVGPGNCYIARVQKTFLLGQPIASSSTLIYPSGQRGVNPVSLCAGCTYNFFVDYVPYATSYTWVLPSGFSFVSGRTTATPGIKTATSSGTYVMNCAANNGCGASWTHSLTIKIGGGGGQQQQMIAVHPNPSSKDLTVELTQSDLTISDVSTSETSAFLTTETFTAKILDEFGSEIKAGLSENGRIVFDVRSIPKGRYYLQVIRGQEVIVRQIVIG
jgi:hypothetical protein